MPIRGMVKSITDVKGGRKVSLGFGQQGRDSALSFYTTHRDVVSPAKGSIRAITVDIGKTGLVTVLSVEKTPKLNSYKGRSR